MRPRRLSTILATTTLTVAACTNPPYIPAPWDAVEPQAAEPNTASGRESIRPAWQRIGSSIRGKALTACTVGTGPRRIYVIGGLHGDEPEAPAAAELLPELLAAAKPQSITVRILKDMNPDGGAAKTRTNTRRVDLERNWPSKDFHKDDRTGDRALSELETSAVNADISAFKPDILVVFQSANIPPTVSIFGPSPIPANEFARAARTVDPHWRFTPQRSSPVPGSIESLFGRDLGKIVFRVEFQRNRPADLNARAAAAGLLSLEHPATSPNAASPVTPAVTRPSADASTQPASR